MMDQEKAMVEQEKNRVQMLLQGMQNVMTAYNASGNLLPPAISNKSRPGTIHCPHSSLIRECIWGFLP